jgi:hypothetical protein
MYKNLTVFAFFICLSVLPAFQAAEQGQCDSKTLKEDSKKTLENYKYDSAKLTKIGYKTKESVKEIEVPLFLGEKYRFIFNTATISKTVVINVFKKDKESRNRKLLWTSKDDAPSIKEHIFEHTHSMKVFVDYTIPPADSSALPGCVLFMLGYK